MLFVHLQIVALGPARLLLFTSGNSFWYSLSWQESCFVYFFFQSRYERDCPCTSLSSSRYLYYFDYLKSSKPTLNRVKFSIGCMESGITVQDSSLANVCQRQNVLAVYEQ